MAVSALIDKFGNVTVKLILFAVFLAFGGCTDKRSGRITNDQMRLRLRQALSQFLSRHRAMHGHCRGSGPKEDSPIKLATK